MAAAKTVNRLTPSFRLQSRRASVSSRRDLEASLCAPIGINSRTGPIRRKIEQRGGAAQVFLPIFQVLSKFAASQQLSLPYGVIAVLNWQGGQLRALAAATGTIESRQISPKITYRSPVANDVMHHQDHDMIRLPKAKQSDTDPGFCLEVVWNPRLVDQQTLDFRFALWRRKRTQVNLLELEGPAVVRNRERLIVDDLYCGSNIFTAGNDGVKRLSSMPTFSSPRIRTASASL